MRDGDSVWVVTETAIVFFFVSFGFMGVADEASLVLWGVDGVFLLFRFVF